MHKQLLEEGSLPASRPSIPSIMNQTWRPLCWWSRNTESPQNNSRQKNLGIPSEPLLPNDTQTGRLRGTQGRE
jgi:hypothetical protein